VSSGTCQKFHFNDYLVDTLIEKVREMRPLLAAKAARHEEIGELTPEVVEALSAARLFWMALPERLGGLAISSRGQSQVVAEVARGCPSTAWTLSIINSNVWLASAMSFEMQDFVFSDKTNPPRACGPTNGSGSLTPDGDHFILNGRWAYGSGSHHATFALVPAKSPDGAMNFVALPLADAKIENTWKVAGMKGTGSDTVVAENVRIGKDQFTHIAGVGDTVSLHVSSNGLSPDARKAELLEATDYWIGLTLLRSKTLAIIFGTAQGLMDEVLKTRQKGIMFTTYEHRDESQVFQASLGKCHAKLAAVEALLYQTCDLNDLGALQGRALTMEERLSSRSQTVIAVEILTDAVTELMKLYGTSAYMEKCPAQRYWRDYMVGSSHGVFTADPGYETIGKYILGIEPNITIPTFF